MIILEVLLQILVNLVLLLVLLVVNGFEDASRLRQVVGQVNVLQYLLLVQPVEGYHHFQRTKSEAVSELIRILRQVGH